MSHRAQRSGSSNTGSRQLNFPFLSSTTGRDEAARSSPLSRSRTKRRSDAAQLQRANSGTEPATAPSSHSCARDGTALTRSLHPHRIPPAARPPDPDSGSSRLTTTAVTGCPGTYDMAPHTRPPPPPEQKRLRRPRPLLPSASQAPPRPPPRSSRRK